VVNGDVFYVIGGFTNGTNLHASRFVEATTVR
jgi:hypothetical protein